MLRWQLHSIRQVLGIAGSKKRSDLQCLLYITFFSRNSVSFFELGVESEKKDLKYNKTSLSCSKKAEKARTAKLEKKLRENMALPCHSSHARHAHQVTSTANFKHHLLAKVLLLYYHQQFICINKHIHTYAAIYLYMQAIMQAVYRLLYRHLTALGSAD